MQSAVNFGPLTEESLPPAVSHWLAPTRGYAPPHQIGWAYLHPHQLKYTRGVGDCAAWDCTAAISQPADLDLVPQQARHSVGPRMVTDLTVLLGQMTYSPLNSGTGIKSKLAARLPTN
jgi:hypothetical protein